MDQELTNKIRETFTAVFGEPGLVYAAPGRVNLIGEHTDYNEGFVLPGAIDKVIAIEIKKNNTDFVNAFSLDFGERVSFTPPAAKTRSYWANYILGVVMELRTLGCQIGGFDCVVGGNIPLGAGLSSSAALESVFAFALNDIFSLGLSRLQLAHVGQLAEHNYAGVRCGIMDQFASLHGRSGNLMKLDCRSLEYELIPFNPKGIRVVLLDTKVKHTLASTEYNIRRQQCEEGVVQLRRKHPEVNSLRDISLEMLQENKMVVSPVVFNRCKYVVEENIRLLLACEALQKNDYQTFGAMIFESHHGLSTLYEVSCPELDFLARHAMKYLGVLGARMMGGGFGGCTINLVQEHDLERFIESARHEFELKFKKELTAYEVVISDGVHRIK